jgi:WD40 repeat protein
MGVRLGPSVGRTLTAALLAAALVGCGNDVPSRSPAASPGVTATLTPAATTPSFAPSPVPTLQTGLFGTGNLLSPRRYETATLLDNARVLIAGGQASTEAAPLEAALSEAELYDPATGAFSATGSMATARWGHAATLLPDGRILITGGYASGKSLDSAEIYDPATGAFSPTGSMIRPRVGHTATLLKNGHVLITGGYRSDVSLVSYTAELYDPATGKFTSTGSMFTPRLYQTATLLPDGRVLVAGGFSSEDGPDVGLASGPVEASAEIYDPSTGKFRWTGSMTTSRANHRAVALSDGRVLIVGTWVGEGDATPSRSAELYDPKTAKFNTTGGMGSGLTGGVAAALPDGKVLVAGGGDGKVDVELYDATNGKFFSAGNLSHAGDGAAATALQDGSVLIAGGDTGGLCQGGCGSSLVDLYREPADFSEAPTRVPSGTFVPTGSMSAARLGATSVLLADGRVLIAGGSSAGDARSAELYDPKAGIFHRTGSTSCSISELLRMPNGRVLVTCGDGTIEFYDASRNAFSAPSHVGITPASATLLQSGRVLLIAATGAAEIYDPTRGTSASTGSMLHARNSFIATRLVDGRVLVAGGSDASGPLASAELYDPATGAFKATGSMLFTRSGHAAVLLKNERVLIAFGSGSGDCGGQTTGQCLSHGTLEVELYDPSTGLFTSAGTAGVGPFHPALAMLADGRILMTGGGENSGVVRSTAQAYDPAKGTFSQVGSMVTPRYDHTLTLLQDGRVLVAGGGTFSADLSSAEVFQP